MIVKLAALAGLGYAGLRLYRNGSLDAALGRVRRSTRPDIALAGGPLSREARLVHAGEEPRPAA